MPTILTSQASGSVAVAQGEDVAEARRMARRLSERALLSEIDTERIATIVSEMGTNLSKHARDGRIYMSFDHASVGVIASDRGPGIRNVDAALTDGFSTAGSMGTGLGAIGRLADRLDISSEPGRGTIMVAEIFPGSNAASYPAAAVWVPAPSEDVCGDGWAILRSELRTRLFLADGLGHGVEAKEATDQAIGLLNETMDRDLVATLRFMHEQLRHSRGLAAAIADVDESGEVTYAGVGNISGYCIGSSKRSQMVSSHGIVGHEFPRSLKSFDYILEPGGTLILHSDGVVSHWDLGEVVHAHPAIVAATLLRDHIRGRDDASCLVIGRRP